MRGVPLLDRVVSSSLRGNDFSPLTRSPLPTSKTKGSISCSSGDIILCPFGNEAAAVFPAAR